MFPKELEHFKSTLYHKLYSELDRKQKLEEAVEDLILLFAKEEHLHIANKIQECYDHWHGIGSAKCATMIWTSIEEVASVINCALTIDAAESYEENTNKFRSYSKYLSINNLRVKDIIEKSIKFVRFLNTSIIAGFEYNTTDRSAYLAVPKSSMWDQKVGTQLRIANLVSASANEASVDEFKNDDNYIILKFNIKEGCCNAGMINKFGKSKYPDKDETLLPPYTFVTFKSIDPRGKYRFQ